MNGGIEEQSCFYSLDILWRITYISLQYTNKDTTLWLWSLAQSDGTLVHASEGQDTEFVGYSWKY